MKKIITLILASVLTLSLVAGCTPKEEGNSEQVKEVDLKEVHEAVKEEFGEDYIPNMEMDLEQIEDLLGLKEEDMEDYIVETPMFSINVDTFIAIKAKEGKADDVEKALNDYRENIVENSIQYPMNLAKVNASKVVRHEDYSFFIMLGAFDERDDATEEQALEFAKEEVKRAEQVINGFFK